MRVITALTIAVAATLSCSRPPTLVAATDQGANGIQAYFEADPAASPDQVDRYGSTALHILIAHGDTIAVLALLTHAPNLEQKDSHDRTPLYLAAQLGNAEQVDALLLAGADPNSSNGAASDTPLHVACISGPLGMVETLLAHGADVHRKNRWGQSPLFSAARGPALQSESISALLLASGARVDVTDQQGFTALHVAAAHDQQRTIRILIAAHADRAALSRRGSTPLDVALENHRDLGAEALFDANAPRHSSKLAPPLFQAAEADDDIWTLHLLANGSDPHLRFEGRTALDVAREHHADDTAVLLAGR